MSKFKKLEEALERFTEIAVEAQEKQERFSDLEEELWEMDGRIDDKRCDVYEKAEDRIDKMRVVSEKKCDCCGTVLSRTTKESQKIEDEYAKLDDYVDNHPEVKALEARREVLEQECSELDNEISKLANKIYDAEADVKDALYDIVPDNVDADISFYSNIF